jgi:hypothetical protein
MQRAPRQAAKQPLGNTADLASRAQKARKSKHRYELQATARRLLPNLHRIQSCHRRPAHGQIYASIETNGNRSRLAGIHTCDNIVCPVCAPKIAMRHAKELAAAAAAAYAKGWKILHVTYTLSHHRGEALHNVLANITDARRKYFLAGRAWQKIKMRLAIEGSARSLEVTYGENGWHPHFHELLFISGQTDPDLETTLRNQWLRAVSKVGGHADFEHGLKVEEGHQYISEYLNKFGRLPSEGGSSVEMELSHGHTKVARKEGQTPFAMLESAHEGDEQAGQKYAEYACAIAGKAIIRWSCGLREILGLEVGQIDSCSLDEEQPFAQVAALSWLALKKCSTLSLFPAVLMAATAGFDTLEMLLDDYDLVPDKDIPKLFVPRSFIDVAYNRHV